VLDAVQQRLDTNPQAIRQRRDTTEQPFATPFSLGFTHFGTLDGASRAFGAS